MSNFKITSQDLLETLKSTSDSEMNLFKVDFQIVLQKTYALFHAFLETLPNIVIAVMVFGLIMLASRFFRAAIRRQERIPHSVTLVLERLSRIAFALLGFFVVLAIIFPSIKPVDLLGGVGVVSLVVGFAVKDLLNNFLSGILILLQQPFRVGDEIKHKDLEGIVDSIHIRYTVLIGYDGRRFLIPNGEIYSSTIVVNTLSNCRWSYCEICIDHDNDIDEATEVLLRRIKQVEGVMKEPSPSVTVTSITSNAITLKCAWATSPFNREMSKVKSNVLKQIKSVLQGEYIKSPMALELFSQSLSVVTPNTENNIENNASTG